MNKLLLTPEKAVEVTSLGRSTIYELIRAGQIESIRVGRSRRITPEALRRFINDREADGDA